MTYYKPFGPVPVKKIVIEEQEKMDSRLKKKWIEALESGEYKRTVGTLRRVGPRSGEVIGHCCLGVLAEVCKMTIADEKLARDEAAVTNGDIIVKGENLGYDPIHELIGKEHADALIEINDADDTRGYKKQIEYIKENL